MFGFLLTNWHLIRARLGLPGARAPIPYIRALFDGYAEDFDDHVMRRLSYKVPNLMLRLLRPHLTGGPSLIDLGCGTGLCAALLAPHCRAVVGLDASPEMLEQAKLKRCYDELFQGDLLKLPVVLQGRFDLAVAGDVFVYFGDLTRPLTAARQTLRPGGRLAFSLEAGGVKPDEPWSLTRTGRFAHTDDHVQTAAAAAGLTVEIAESAVLRTQSDRPVTGRIYLMRAQPQSTG